MKKLLLLSILLAAVGLAPFTLNEWLVVREHQHRHELATEREKYERAWIEWQNKNDLEKGFYITLDQTYGESYLAEATRVRDYIAMNEARKLIDPAPSFYERYYAHRALQRRFTLDRTLHAHAVE